MITYRSNLIGQMQMTIFLSYSPGSLNYLPNSLLYTCWYTCCYTLNQIETHNPNKALINAYLAFIAMALGLLDLNCSFVLRLLSVIYETVVFVVLIVYSPTYT